MAGKDVTMTGTAETTMIASGLRVHVRQSGTGRPLLLINGLGSSSEMWGEVETLLGRHSRTIAYDSPGTGRSETPLVPLSVSALARVALAVADRLGHEQVDVLGYSFGGAVAQQLARDQPHRVRRLALVSTWCGWGGDAGSPAAMARASRKLNEIGNPVGYSYQLWSLATWSSLPWLSRIEAPTLILSGADDDLVPASNAVRIARQVPNSSLHLLPNGGHLIMFGRESAGPRLLSEFFSAPSLEDSTAWANGLLAA